MAWARTSSNIVFQPFACRVSWSRQWNEDGFGSGTSRIIRRFIDWNIRLSRGLDRLLPADYVIDGNSDFESNFAPKWLKANARVVDIGGGKNPFLTAERKNALAIHVTGVDISAQGLREHPLARMTKSYARIYRRQPGTCDADLCICEAVLEHVQDVAAAFGAIASLLRTGGVALIFVPSRNAVFARLNLLLPERIKRFVLFTIFPHTKRDQGFPSYYNKCTPADFRALAPSAGLEIQEAKYYYETFSMAMKKVK